jgi:hypothetical protein
MEKERNRNLMLRVYEFKCGHSAAAAIRNTRICRIEDVGTIKESTCRRWFAKFLKNRSGRKSRSSIVVELSFWDKDGWKLLPIPANIYFNCCLIF